MQVQLENLGTVNKNRVDLGDLTIWFSYETPVGYQLGYAPRVVRENDWGVTTGKLLNELQPNKSLRISGEQFEKQLQEILDRLSFNSVTAIESGAGEAVAECHICGAEHDPKTHMPNMDTEEEGDHV